MVNYGIGIPPLTKNLKAEFTDVTKTWYADNADALGMFSRVKLYFNSLQRFSLGRGYYPKLSKIVLIVHTVNLKSGKRFGLCHGFKVCTGARYLGFLSGMTGPYVIG